MKIKCQRCDKLVPIEICFCERCVIKIKQQEYKKGFRDGLNACKPNKKLDKAIKEGVEM